MSKVSKRIIECPNCGENIEVCIWESLNTRINPQQKNELLNSQLFKVKCSNCNQEFNLDYPILYHDEINKIMIFYCNNTLEAIKLMSEYKTNRFLKNYTLRVVNTQDDLIEKALIFDNKLNDKVIEILKYITKVSAQEKHTELDLNEVHLIKENDNQFFFQFNNREDLLVLINFDLYDKIERLKYIHSKALDSFFVNQMLIEKHIIRIIKMLNIDNSCSFEELKTINNRKTKCQECGIDLNYNSGFCYKCGAKISSKKILFCRKCGNKLITGADFCNKCGTKIEY